MSKQFSVLKTPKRIPEAVKQKYINSNGFLEVNLKSKVPAVQDMLLKLYYYDYIYFIYNYGKGKIFYHQLIAYMKKVHKLTEGKIKEAVDQLYYFRLIGKKNCWNSKLIYLTAPSLNFFNQFSETRNLRPSTDIASLLRTAFIVENAIQFEPEKRQFYTYLIKTSNFLQAGTIEYLRNMLLIIPQKVSKNSEGEYLITFGMLDLQSSKQPFEIAEKINTVNSLFSPTNEKVFFKINFCLYEEERYTYIQKKWEKQKSMLQINAYRFRGIEFTNLNVKRFFDYQSNKNERGK